MSAEYNAKFANTDIATRAIHAGQEPDPTTGAVVTPIFATSTFKQDGVLGLRGGHDYSRSINPTRTSFGEQLAAVEGGKYALSFSSGLAAIDVLLRSTIKPGDNILLGNDVYGGTYRLLSKVFVPWGVGLDVVNITDLKAVETALASKHYQYVWVETPSNPLLNITDIAATTEVAHKYGTKVAVDNTFASPALQHPLADGADVVVYSTTKYIGGHSDVVGGAVVVNDEETREKVAFLQNAAGAVPSPFDSWLDIRGLKTLDLRVKRHSANALKVVYYLNLIKILCGLVEVSLLRALEYQEAVRDREYLEGTHILKTEYFMERLKLFHSIKEQKIGSYALLQIENPEMTLEETDRILKNKIRENDILGISEDGQLYLILSQVDDAMLPIVIERLEKNGLHCRVIDTRNESRVAEE